MRMAGSPSSSAAGPANRGENATRRITSSCSHSCSRAMKRPATSSPCSARNRLSSRLASRRTTAGESTCVQLDEGITTEGFTLDSIKSVGGCEFDPQLLIVGGVHVGEAGAGHQRYRRIIVLRKRDVPVPPVLIVTPPSPGQSRRHDWSAGAENSPRSHPQQRHLMTEHVGPIGASA